MEPNKFETKIREKVSAHEITPSDSSWERLDAMLPDKMKSKSKRNLIWIPVAASLLITIGFFLNTSGVQELTRDKGVKAVANSTDSSNNYTVKKSAEIKVLTQEKRVAISFVNQSLLTKQTPVKMRIGKANDSISQIQNRISSNEKEIGSKIQNVLVESEKDNEKEIRVSVLKQVPVNEKIKVDANSLLSEVDRELEQTFREKVITKIGKNYQEIKVVLVTRNQE
ncbi:MAG: hypothetical protein KA210_13925 [Bacteroidia bacterium]|nr:hypothetical protein [Bacteroidia bacterium]